MRGSWYGRCRSTGIAPEFLALGDLAAAGAGAGEAGGSAFACSEGGGTEAGPVPRLGANFAILIVVSRCST
ncbi:hypothetical protein SBA5_280008 [Candidatus Sulfotelmatomonas gaucii]|uniref:Uncharacterized protein n=1 Tax=Candidatus Sulfuritelmatomonas gaucii TaxID=2043161 RepID=A0A2N9LA17_9BACT|nr:hypothetical protein SBA5_280008 [Candidatus Sulfotelmatomonas gaucii]